MPHPGSSPPTPDPAQPDPSAPRIRLLSTATVNRIAAGEVIERPAAAVKELVENALDAGATRIAVALGGGRHRPDRGHRRRLRHGRGRAGLAVQRHCTSKLADDSLVRITTLGFRGEALPSIGAAARLHITSRPPGADHACGISVEGGVVGAVAPGAGARRAPGCWCGPVLRHPGPAQIPQAGRAPRPNRPRRRCAGWRWPRRTSRSAWRVDGRVVFDLPAQDRLARVAALLGADAAAVLLAVGRAGRAGAVRLRLRARWSAAPPPPGSRWW